MSAAPAGDPASPVDAPATHAATVTLDVWRLRRRDAARAMVNTPLWGRRVAHGGGVGFAKLLGTGGRSFAAVDADLTRWVTLTVWDSPVAGPPAPPAFARDAVDHWGARLAPLTSRGSWAGRTPFAAPGRAAAATWPGEVLALTRARLTPRRAAAFWRAVPPVAASLPTAAGLLATMAVGEAPVGYQGTLSLWRDSTAVAAFAWRDPAHRAVVDRTPRARWYAEELFARFAVVERTGPVTLWDDKVRPGRST